MTTISATRLASVFVEVADTLVDDFDVIEFLQMVTVRTAEVVGTAAAGLLLADHRRRLQVVAASEERATLLEVFQVQAHEGPCQDAFARGLPVVAADLRAEAGRWPLFAPRALEAGYRSVHAFPLRLRREVIGAMGLFSDDAGRMDPGDLLVVQALADVATIGVLQERTVHRGAVLTEQLQGALDSRVVIEQAKGVVAQLQGTTVDEAFEALRSSSRRNHRRLVDVAREVVQDPSAAAALVAG